MKRFLPLIFLGLLAVSRAEDAGAPTVAPDLLRFSNGNRLDGHFAGVKAGAGVAWKRDDVEAVVEFKTAQLRQVVLRGGRPAKPLPDLSSITLVDGDRIPGTIVGINATDVTIETAFAGTLVIPRTNVAMLSPNPLGGKMLYNGPFSDEGWSTKGQVPEEAATARDKDQEKDKEKDKNADGAETRVPSWSYSTGSWYHRQGSAALVRDVGMTDQSVLRFQMAWKTRLSMAVAFHADFKEPPQAAADPNAPAMIPNVNRARMGMDAGGGNLPQLFGNAYVMNLYTGYVVLNRCGFDAAGKPFVERLQTTTSNNRLAEIGEATVEIRCSRQSGEISLYVNGDFTAQWTENTGPGDDGYAGHGGGIGFQVQGFTVNNQSGPVASPVRISDIMVAEWNGMPDAARSMQTNDQDIVLLTNGTDRFSGEITGLENGKLRLKGHYGDFEFPLTEVSESRIARNRLAKAAEPGPNRVSVRFLPFGQVSGTVTDGTESTLGIATPSAGKISLNLDSAVMLDFKDSNSFLDDWDLQY